MGRILLNSGERWGGGGRSVRRVWNFDEGRGIRVPRRGGKRVSGWSGKEAQGKWGLESGTDPWLSASVWCGRGGSGAQQRVVEAVMERIRHFYEGEAKTWWEGGGEKLSDFEVARGGQLLAVAEGVLGSRKTINDVR